MFTISLFNRSILHWRYISSIISLMNINTLLFILVTTHALSYLKLTRLSPAWSTRVLLGDGQKELELWRKFLLRIQSVGKINAADAAIGVDLNSERFDVIGTICASGEIRQIKLNLIPAFVQSHGHRANKRLNASR
jgi:hypothetical protein